LWPTDKQIMQTIHHSHRLALELTPANPENLSIDINNSLIKSAHMKMKFQCH
ncbi:15963_t:CDS:2, partial [Rhizophagus irregularis]